MLEDEALTGRVIGAATEVHRGLGPGFLEKVYEEAVCLEFQRRGIRYRRQAEVRVEYLGVDIGLHRLDLLVHDRLVVELKAISGIEEIHLAVLLSYLRATDLRLGLLLNFAGPRLQIKRVLNPHSSFRPSALPR